MKHAEKIVHVKIPVRDEIYNQVDLKSIVSQCQHVSSLAFSKNSSRLSIGARSKFVPHAISEATAYIAKHYGLFQRSHDQTSHLFKVKVDEATWKAFNIKVPFSGVADLTRIWHSRDKDNSIIFQCSLDRYQQALIDLTESLVAIHKAQFVEPAKLRKYRLSLEERVRIQELYSSSGNSVPQIAARFRVSPASVYPFCILDRNLHPELFLTTEEVERCNSIFSRESSSYFQ